LELDQPIRPQSGGCAPGISYGVVNRRAIW
jgi:hypothetical protein